MIARGRLVDDSAQLPGIDVEVVTDVDEAGGRPGFEDRVQGRDEREGTGDHLVARPDPERLHRRDQRGRAVVDRDRVLDPCSSANSRSKRST